MLSGLLFFKSDWYPFLAVYAQELSPRVRVKDLAVVEGARSNQLTGMGLVVGLPELAIGPAWPRA